MQDLLSLNKRTLQFLKIYFYVELVNKNECNIYREVFNQDMKTKDKNLVRNFVCI